MTVRWVVRVAVVQVPNGDKKERTIISVSKTFPTLRSNSRALASALSLYRKLIKMVDVDD